MTGAVDHAAGTLDHGLSGVLERLDHVAVERLPGLVLRLVPGEVDGPVVGRGVDGPSTMSTSASRSMTTLVMLSSDAVSVSR